jgi:hypothetical protein
VEGTLEGAVDVVWEEASLRSSLSSTEEGQRYFCSVEMGIRMGKMP